MKADTLIFGGGGIRSVCYIGAVHALKEAGCLHCLSEVIGVSAGSFFAVAVALGIDTQCLLTFISILHALEVNKQLSCVHFMNLLSKGFGLDTGQRLFEEIDRFLCSNAGVAREELTFKWISEHRGIRVKIVATNLTHGKAEVFDCTSCASMPVCDAVRMSCALPLYMTFVEYSWQGRSCIFVDGGLLNNMPCDYSTNQEFIALTVSSASPKYECTTLAKYLMALVQAVWHPTQSRRIICAGRRLLDLTQTVQGIGVSDVAAVRPCILDRVFSDAKDMTSAWLVRNLETS